jgi:hypothetical protein
MFTRVHFVAQRHGAPNGARLFEARHRTHCQLIIRMIYPFCGHYLKLDARLSSYLWESLRVLSRPADLVLAYYLHAVNQ